MRSGARVGMLSAVPAAVILIGVVIATREWYWTPVAVGVPAIGAATGVVGVTAIPGTPAYRLWFTQKQQRWLGIGVGVAWVWLAVVLYAGEESGNNHTLYALAGLVPVIVALWALSLLWQATSTRTRSVEESARQSRGSGPAG